MKLWTVLFACLGAGAGLIARAGTGIVGGYFAAIPGATVFIAIGAVIGALLPQMREPCFAAS